MKKKAVVLALALAFAAPMAHASSWWSFFGAWFTTNPSIANN